MIKVAVFDFDNTLAVKRKQFPGTESEFYTEAYQSPHLFYRKYYEAPESMKMLVKTLRQSGTNTFICMSHMPYSINFKAKELFVKTFYGRDFEMMSTESPEAKIRLINMMARYVWDVHRDEVLLVDDRAETRLMAQKNGCEVIDPATVDTFFMSAL